MITVPILKKLKIKEFQLKKIYHRDWKNKSKNIHTKLNSFNKSLNRLFLRKFSKLNLRQERKYLLLKMTKRKLNLNLSSYLNKLKERQMRISNKRLLSKNKQRRKLKSCNKSMKEKWVRNYQMLKKRSKILNHKWKRNSRRKRNKCKISLKLQPKTINRN